MFLKRQTDSLVLNQSSGIKKRAAGIKTIQALFKLKSNLAFLNQLISLRIFIVVYQDEYKIYQGPDATTTKG